MNNKERKMKRGTNKTTVVPFQEHSPTERGGLGWHQEYFDERQAEYRASCQGGRMNPRCLSGGRVLRHPDCLTEEAQGSPSTWSVRQTGRRRVRQKSSQILQLESRALDLNPNPATYLPCYLGCIASHLWTELSHLL